MKHIKAVSILFILLIIGCDDSLNGPVGSNLNYEPQFLSVGETADFGKIKNDAITIRIVGVDGSNYQLEHSDKICGSCPLSSNNENLKLIMCNGKYEVTFIANNMKNNQFTLQLQYYKNL